MQQARLQQIRSYQTRRILRASFYPKVHMLPTCRNAVRMRIVQRRCPSSKEWEREHRARETPEQREARLYQRRLRDRERAYFTCCLFIYDRTPSNFACSQDYKRASFYLK